MRWCSDSPGMEIAKVPWNLRIEFFSGKLSMSHCWWLCLGHGTLKIKWIGLKMRNYTASGEPPKLPWLIFNRSSILCILHRSTGKTAGNWIFHQPTILCKSSTTSIVSAAEFRIVRCDQTLRRDPTQPIPSALGQICHLKTSFRKNYGGELAVEKERHAHSTIHQH